jgi:periplasmic divalent cation tolerance protein
MPPAELCELVITSSDSEWLDSFSREVIVDRLAATAHNSSPVRSLNRVDGQLCEQTEARVSFYTRRSRVQEIVDRAHAQRNGDLLSIWARPITDGDPAYLEWITGESQHHHLGIVH